MKKLWKINLTDLIFFCRYFAPFPPDRKSYSGNHILLLRFRDADPTNFHFLTGLKICTAMFDLQTAKTPLADGYEVILDSRDVQLGHLIKTNISLLKKGVLYLQVCVMLANEMKTWAINIEKVVLDSIFLEVFVTCLIKSKPLSVSAWMSSPDKNVSCALPVSYFTALYGTG